MNSGRGENLDVAEWLCKIHCIIVTLSLCQYMMHAMKFLDEIFDLLFQLLKRRMNANEENILMQNLHRRLIFWMSGDNGDRTDIESSADVGTDCTLSYKSQIYQPRYTGTIKAEGFPFVWKNP